MNNSMAPTNPINQKLKHAISFDTSTSPPSTKAIGKSARLRRPGSNMLLHSSPVPVILRQRVRRVSYDSASASTSAPQLSPHIPPSPPLLTSTSTSNPPMPPSKKQPEQNGQIGGMKKGGLGELGRAMKEKFNKRLDEALDFVDGK